MKKLLGIIALSILSMTLAGYAVEYPQFKSAVSTTGISANFDTLYLKADTLKAVHEIVEHDAGKIIWKYKDTGNWAIINDDGTVVIAGPSAFSLDIKYGLDSDLDRAKNLVRSIKGVVSEAPLAYYADDPYLYRVVTYDFNTNFNLKLAMPNATIERATISVLGKDSADVNAYGEITVPGQHYSINSIEVSGCDAKLCSGYTKGAKGISCVPLDCKSSGGPIFVSVANPIDITNKITTGVQDISASGIANEHTLILEALTSFSEDEMLLFSDDSTILISETRSSPMANLYALIQTSTDAINTTSNE